MPARRCGDRFNARAEMTTDTPVLPRVRVVALYRFAAIDDCVAVQARLSAACLSGVRGTLLIAPEGLNGTMAGPHEAIEILLDAIRDLPGFADLDVKESTAATMPFHRLKIRIKTEIVTMGRTDLDPVRNAGLYVSPADWNRLISDPDTIVIDTRNDYEGAIGAFAGAVQPNTRSFRDFPDWFEREGRALLDRPTPPKVAMYCTGGIRCEKATAFLRAEGVDQVHHLEGGILRYLETVPEADSLWQGECFVFDERVAIGHGLEPGSHTLCRGCRMPLGAADRASPRYVEGVCCDRCHATRTPEQRDGYAERQRQMEIAVKLGIDHVGAVLDRSEGLSRNP